MSTATHAIPDRRRLTMAETLSDSNVMLVRQLRKILRRPMYVVYLFVQPVIFVLLFRYVFGGAINTGRVSYVDYLLPGIIVMTAIFGSLTTGLGLTEDMKAGAVDRFRSLPIARSAVLLGRTTADLAINALTLLIMLALGVAVGFRPTQPAYEVALGLLLVLAFAYVFLLDQRVHRDLRPRPRDGAVGGLHLGVPARVRLLGVRSHPFDAGRHPLVRGHQPGHADG
jgi:hypothetical protein